MSVSTPFWGLLKYPGCHQDSPSITARASKQPKVRKKCKAEKLGHNFKCYNFLLHNECLHHAEKIYEYEWSRI